MRVLCRSWLVAFVVAGLSMPVGAHHDACEGVVTGILILDDQATLYLDDRGTEGVWVYLESTGAPGLQRGGAIGDLIVDPCGDPASADLLLAHVPAVS